MLFALAAQAAAVASMAAAAWLIWSLPFWPFLYGGAVAMANAGMLAWRWHAGLRDYHCDGPRHLRGFRRSFTERFFVVVLLLAAGFALGLVMPGFRPLPMLIGFIVGQLTWVIAAAARKTEDG